MQKAFENFTWENSPSTATPLGASLLNTINNAIDEIDSRVCEHDATIILVKNKAEETLEEAKKAVEKADSAIETAKKAAEEAEESASAAQSSAEEAKAAAESIPDTYATKEYVNAGLSEKQDTLTAGRNITIEGNVISATGGGGGGTSDYLDLSNKPKINNVELTGNVSLETLNIAPLSEVDLAISRLEGDIMGLARIVGEVNDMLEEV